MKFKNCIGQGHILDAAERYKIVIYTPILWETWKKFVDAGYLDLPGDLGLIDLKKDFVLWRVGLMKEGVFGHEWEFVSDYSTELLNKFYLALNQLYCWNQGEQKKEVQD